MPSRALLPIMPHHQEPEADFVRITNSHQADCRCPRRRDVEAESQAVLQYQLIVTEAAHNVVLLHLLRCMVPMLEKYPAEL